MIFGSKSWRSLKICGSGLNRTRVPFLPPGPRALRTLRHRRQSVASAERLRKLLLPAPHRHLRALAQRVHHGDAHAVQTSAHVVSALVAAELTARVRTRQSTVSSGGVRWLGGCRWGCRRPCVLDAVLTYPSGSMVTVTHGVASLNLVDAVVEHLPDHVVEALDAGVSDVHAGRFRTGSRPLRTWMEPAP